MVPKVFRRARYPTLYPGLPCFTNGHGIGRTMLEVNSVQSWVRRGHGEYHSCWPPHQNIVRRSLLGQGVTWTRSQRTLPFGCLRGVESNEYFSDDALSHVAQTDGHLYLTDVDRLVDTYYYRVVLTWSAFATSSNIISIMISRISFWISSDVHCIWWSSWLYNAFVNQGISLIRRWRIRAFKRWKRTNWSRFLPENLD